MTGSPHDLTHDSSRPGSLPPPATPPATPESSPEGRPSDDPVPEASPPPRSSRLVGGLLLLTAGVLWLLDVTDVADLRWRLILPVGLIALGLAVVVLSFWTHAGGLIGVGAALTVLVVASALLPDHLSARIGEQEQRPIAVEQLRDRYAHGIGELTIDLRDLDVGDLPGVTTIRASVGVGSLDVRVPPDLTVVVAASVGVGEVSVFGRSNSGVGVDVEETNPSDADRTLRLELSVGLGEIEVRP